MINNIMRFCVSHAKPLLPNDWYDYCISLGDYQLESPTNVRQLDRFWYESRPIAYGAAGTHVLPIVIEKFASSASHIEILSYRKRVIPTPEGVESTSFPTMQELTRQQLLAKGELFASVPPAGLEFLLAQPLSFEESVIGQYAACHYREDILDYAAIAVELGVLGKGAVGEFLEAKHFIPGGAELGVYPKSWSMHSLAAIERVSREFLVRHGSRIETYGHYQIRAVQFLSERLGSYLLIRQLVELYPNCIPAGIFGYMTTIVEENAEYVPGLGDPQ